MLYFRGRKNYFCLQNCGVENGASWNVGRAFLSKPKYNKIIDSEDVLWEFNNRKQVTLLKKYKIPSEDSVAEVTTYLHQVKPKINSTLFCDAYNDQFWKVHPYTRCANMKCGFQTTAGAPVQFML